MGMLSVSTKPPIRDRDRGDRDRDRNRNRERSRDKERTRERETDRERSRDRDKDTPAYEVKLERVLGLTVSSNAALDCDPSTEVVAFPAGCTVVLFHPRKNRQTHLVNSSRKTITSLAFSSDGRYLVTGECGHLPSVRVWDLQEGPAWGQQLAEFPGHKYGINCVAFSPTHKYVVSVGSQHDMIVNVWDWRGNIKVASNKVSSKVKAVSFSENGNYFVTVGNRHVKFWYLEYSRAAKYKEPVPLMGRSAILGEQRNNYFCDVACGRGECGDSTYAITKSGLLCEFNNRRLLDKWVELRTTSANCMSVGEHHIFIGCAEGIVRCFSPSTLQFITTLPRTHYLGVDVSQGLNISHMASHPNNAKYPDAIALAFDYRNNKLTCVYNDHSLYVWDVRDIKRVGKSHSFLYHSACIWGVEMYPPLENGDMPPGSFITCSSDDTIRIWNLEPDVESTQGTTYRRNIYSNELLRVQYVDPELTYLKDLDLSTSEKTDSSYDGRNGVRSIRVGPDGRHLASGDRAGNIRIHEIKNLNERCRIEAHDAEVLCLEYTRLDSGHKLLASASRDRLIHVFSVKEEYNFLQTLDDHSSSITAVRFLNAHDQLQMVSCGADKSIIFRHLTSPPGSPALQFSRGHNAAGKTTLYDMEVDCGQKHILTACQDRNIRVYNVSNGKHSKTFKGSVGEDGSLIKVALDPSGIFVATSCTDKTLCVYDYYSGECMATMLGHSELVTGLRFTNDCQRLISASGDGCIFVWHVPHDMVVTMHARLAQQAARAGRRTNKVINGIGLDNEVFGPPPAGLLDPNANSMDQADYRFSVGQLPLWAKKQIAEDVDHSPVTNLSNRPIEPPKGRWAQRLDATGITVKSVYDGDSVIPFPLQQERRLDSDGSKDSSIDSGTEIRQYSEFRRETMVVNKQGDSEGADFLTSPDSLQDILNGEDDRQVTSGKVTVSRGSELDAHRNRHLTDDSSLGSYKYEDMESTEHDGDVEDYSEGEGESTEPEQNHRLIYYPAAEEANSVFTVNAMDVEELRRSQRRLRKNQRPEKLSDIPRVSPSGVSGSQDSDDDDEDASTPSADTAERNLMSMLSVSTESLDHLGQREKFLKNNFDSLSGAEQDATKDALAGKKSISSQYHGRLSIGGGSSITPRNTAIISAALQSRSEPETSRKREELKKQIEEARRKLQSVGYRSNLKSSQSIQDLSRLPEKERRVGAGHPHRNLRPTGIGNDHPQTTDIPTNIPYSISYSGTPRPDSLSLRNLDAPLPYKSNRKILSLPQSPVCEELISPTSASAYTDTEATRKLGKTRSCSFYIDLNNVAAPEEKKQASKSSESILETVQKESDDADGDGGSFSSDSLESTSAFGKPPRRCVSDFQIFSAVQNTDLEQYRSASVAGHRRQDDLFNSQESILSDMSHPDQLDRHSSASFFLRDTCRSSESILTDESDYQFLFQDCAQRQHNRSTESILTDESDCLGNAGVSGGKGRMASYEDSGFETGGGAISAGDYRCGVFRTRSLHDTRSSRIAAGRASSPMIHDSFMMDSLEPTPSAQLVSSPPLTRSLSLKAKPQSFFIPLDENCRKASELDALKNRRLSQRTLPSQRPPTAPKPNLKSPSPVVAHKPPKPSKASTSPNPRMVLSGSATWTKSRMPAKHIRGIEVKAVGPKETVRTSNVSGQFFERAERATVSPDSSNSDEPKPPETIGSVVKQIADMYGNGKGGALKPGVSNVKMLSRRFERDVGQKAKPRPTVKSASAVAALGGCRLKSSTSVPVKQEVDATVSRSEDGLSDLNDDSLAVLGWDSGSSTPATSSSCANSPKRLWPRPFPGHAPGAAPGSGPGCGHGPRLSGPTSPPAASNQLGKLLALRQQKTLLPSKCFSVDSDDGGARSGGGIRRACSLSDLANPAPRRAPVQVSGKVTNTKSNNSSRILPRPGYKQNSLITRSSSVGMLNQSDSESDLSLPHQPVPAARINGLMRPTIASQNKTVNAASLKNSIGRRRGLSGAYSSMNLSQVGNNEDSSSEEMSSVSKHGRPRSTSIDRSSTAPTSLPAGGQRRIATTNGSGSSRYGSDRESGAPVPPPRPGRLRSSVSNTHVNQLEPSPHDLPVKDTDPASMPLSRELVSSITEQLMRAVDTAVQLHKRMALETPEQSDPLLQGLEGAVGEAQRNLRLIAGGENVGEQPNPDAPADPFASKLAEIVAAGGGGGAGTVHLMQQYSDLLLSVVQQRVQSSSNPAASVPPTQSGPPGPPAKPS